MTEAAMDVDGGDAPQRQKASAVDANDVSSGGFLTCKAFSRFFKVFLRFFKVFFFSNFLGSNFRIFGL